MCNGIMSLAVLPRMHVHVHVSMHERRRIYSRSKIETREISANLAASFSTSAEHFFVVSRLPNRGALNKTKKTLTSVPCIIDCIGLNSRKLTQHRVVGLQQVETVELDSLYEHCHAVEVVRKQEIQDVVAVPRVDRSHLPRRRRGEARLALQTTSTENTND